MIIKGGAAGSVGFWAGHLLRDDTNERAELVEIRGLLAEDLPTGLREMQAIAAQSRSGGNFMYQANLNPERDERLTPEQWREAVDTLEKNLGLEGHQRIVVEHDKNGRVHRHVVWNRVDVETLKVADIGGNYRVHTATARDLEQRFDLSPTPSPASSREQRPGLELWEIRAAERSGIAPAQVAADLTQAWQQTRTAPAFVEKAEQLGYVIARGDRRDYVAVDQAGDVHSLARRIEGAKAADIRERMSDLIPGFVPSVAEAKALQKEREAARGQVPAPIPAPAPVADRPAARVDKIAPTPAAPEKERPAETKPAAPAAAIPKAPPSAPVVQKPPPAPTKSAGLMVRGVGGAADTLTGFLSRLGGSSAPPQPVNQVEKIRQQRVALAALERIKDSMDAGENLKAEDIQKLTPQHLENIRLRGDDALRQLVQQAERERERLEQYGRARER